MEPDHMQIEVAISSTAAVSQAKRQLVAFITENTAPLLGTLRSYVQRMGLARHEEVPAVALEVLQEVVIEALDHVDRFDPARQPMAWLLGIAMNVIKRKRSEVAKRWQRELSFGSLAMVHPEHLTEDEVFDHIVPMMQTGPEETIAANEQADQILALVSQEDQRVLRLAILYDFEREALARELGITPVAARVRLHRALSRLRIAWRDGQIMQQQEEKAEALERKKL